MLSIGYAEIFAINTTNGYRRMLFIGYAGIFAINTMHGYRITLPIGHAEICGKPHQISSTLS